MENHHFFMGKSTIFLWVIFKFASSVSQRHYQAGSNPYGLMTTVPLWLKKNYTAWWFFALPLWKMMEWKSVNSTKGQVGLFRVWGIRPAKVCEASKLQSLFGASRLKASKPQSSKASLAPHASKPQSLKAAKPLWRLTLQSPQSLKAWTLGCFGALALWRLAALSGFGASWRFSDASKPQSLNAWML